MFFKIVLSWVCLIFLCFLGFPLGFSSVFYLVLLEFFFFFWALLKVLLGIFFYFRFLKQNQENLLEKSLPLGN